MDYNGFLEWLLTEKQLSVRSSRDVVSRLRRCLIILDSDVISRNTLNALKEKAEFEACSISVKSQLKRSVILYCEYRS